MIPLAVPNLSGNEAKYLQECIETTFVSSVGPFVNRFESLVAEASGAKAATATSAGTTGLHVALVCAGVKPGDLVIVPSFTFIASANAISHCGGVPWLFDVSNEDWTLDAELLERTLKQETEMTDNGLIHTPSRRKVSAIMPVYTLGTPADMDRINEIAKQYKLPVVADAAAALGATYKNRKSGSLAQLTVYSFNGNKTVTSGGGGMIVSDNEELIKLAKHLTTTARVGTDYHHDQVGFNYRMTNVQAALGCAQMEQLDTFIQAKRAIYQAYAEAFRTISGISLFPSPEWSESSHWFSGIVIEDPDLPSVPELCSKLREKEIEARSFWKPVHLQPPYSEAPKTRQTVSENLWDKVLTLPCSTQLTKNEQNYVIDTVMSILVRK